MRVIKELRDSSDVVISSMGASWTSKDYEMGDNLHLCIHLIWDSVVPTGDLYLEYSADPAQDSDGVVGWEIKNLINLDGSFQSQMFLDSNLAAASFRLRYVRTSGTAALNSYIVQKT